MPLVPLAAQLIPSERPSQSAMGAAYNYQLDTALEQTVAVYLLAELALDRQASDELMALVIDSVQSALEQPNRDDAWLSNALKQINTELEKQHITEELHVAIVAIEGSKLLAANIGSPEIRLYRGRHNQNLADGSASKLKPYKPHFEDVVSGEVKPHDRLLLTTPSFLHNMPLTRVNDVMANNRAQNILSIVAADLADAPQGHRLGMTVLEFLEPAELGAENLSAEPMVIMLGDNRPVPERISSSAKPMVDTITKHGQNGLKRAGHWAKHSAAPALRSVSSRAATGTRKLYKRLRPSSSR